MSCTEVRKNGECEEVLTPYAIDETLAFLESCVWHAPPSPNMTRIMTPKNSAAGSRRYFLETIESW